MVSIANQAPPNCPLATPGKFPSPGADCRGSFYARKLDKQYQAPAVLPSKAGVWHTFQPLEDDTLIYCIHRRERDFGEARPYRRRPSVSPRAMSTMDIALAGLFWLYERSPRHLYAGSSLTPRRCTRSAISWVAIRTVAASWCGRAGLGFGRGVMR